MEICYTNLGSLRAADIKINDDKSSIKYLCTYASREKDLPILLYLIDIKDNVCYYKEYYTGNIVIVLDTIEKTFKELNPNIIDEKIKNIPYLAISSKDIKPIDKEFTKNFFLNEQLNKINSIISDIDYLASKTKTNISNYILEMERIISFKCIEEAYLDNAIYDLTKGYTYKTKRKVIDNK